MKPNPALTWMGTFIWGNATPCRKGSSSLEVGSLRRLAFPYMALEFMLLYGWNCLRPLVYLFCLCFVLWSFNISVFHAFTPTCQIGTWEMETEALQGEVLLYLAVSIQLSCTPKPVGTGKCRVTQRRPSAISWKGHLLCLWSVKWRRDSQSEGERGQDLSSAASSANFHKVAPRWEGDVHPQLCFELALCFELHQVVESWVITGLSCNGKVASIVSGQIKVRYKCLSAEKLGH